MGKRRLKNIKKILAILIVFLTVRDLQAQDFSIDAEKLVFNKASNIFSATGNVKIYFGDVTIKTDALTFDKKSEKIRFKSKIFIKTSEGARILGSSAKIDKKIRSTLAA